MRAARRAWLRALSLVFATAVTGVRAQDPRASAAIVAARDWLAIADRDTAAPSYAAAGAKFRKVLSEQEWTVIHAKERKPRGELKARALFQTAVNAKVPEAHGPGEYILLGFRSSFANQADARETVTLEREGDGVWRVVGYSIR